MERLYIIERKGTREIAMLLGVSQPTAGKILAANGIRLRTKAENKMPTPRGGSLSEKHKAAIAAAHLGKSMGYQPGDNPRWLREERSCAGCGKSIWVRRPQLGAINNFCNRRCHALWRSRQTGAMHPRFLGYVEIQCAQCGKMLRRKPCQLPSRRGRSRAFCNQECSGEWKAANLTGEKVYNWKGGYLPYYGPSWSRARREARRRDGYTCQRCGKTQAELGRALDVHHIIPFREFGIERHLEANAGTNLISYCNSCHKFVEEGRN